MKYKYIISDSKDVYYNLSMEQDLFRYAQKETVLVYLWQNFDAIVIGKNQNPYFECKVHEFEESGGKIARRMSGGGAVYHDLGNLNFSIINHVEHASQVKYQEILSQVMNFLDIETKFNGRNDFLINGKKFSGNACYNNGSFICQHGTILISANIDRMTYFLTPQISKLERNKVKSVDTRVVNLSEIRDEITIDKVRNAFINTCHAEKLVYEIDEKNMTNLINQFSKNKWIYGE